MKLFLMTALLCMAAASVFAQAPAGQKPAQGATQGAKPAAASDLTQYSQETLRANSPKAPHDAILVIPAGDMAGVTTVKRIFDGGNFSANVIRRAPGDPEGALLHKFTSEVYVIQEGRATLQSGGKLKGPITGPPDVRSGKGIDGGKTQEVKAGDVVFIPAGVPHFFSQYSPFIKYLNVRFIDPKYVAK